MSIKHCGKSIPIPRQLSKGLSLDILVDTSRNIVVAASAIVAIEIVCSIFLKISIKELLSLFFALQIVADLMRFKTQMPVETSIFLKAIQSIT